MTVESSKVGRTFLSVLLCASLVSAPVLLGGCSGKRSSKSKYTQEELRDAHELYELREKMK